MKWQIMWELEILSTLTMMVSFAQIAMIGAGILIQMSKILYEIFSNNIWVIYAFRN